MTLSAMFQKPEAQIYLLNSETSKAAETINENCSIMETIDSQMQIFNLFKKYVEYFEKPYENDSKTYITDVKKFLERHELNFFEQFPDCKENIYIKEHKDTLERNLRRWTVVSKVYALLNAASNEDIVLWSDFCDKLGSVEREVQQNDNSLDQNLDSADCISIDGISVHMED